MNDRLYRSRDDRVIGGICAGLAERLDLDPSLVRVGWVVLTFLTGGVFFLLYIVMLIVVPEEPYPGAATAAVPEPGAVPGWTPPPAGGWAAASGPRPAGTTPAWTSPTPADPAAGTAGWPGSSAADATPQQAAADAAAGVPPSTPSGPGWAAPPPRTWADERAARRAARRERRRNADPMAGLMFGAILVLLGLYFLAEQYNPSLDLGRFWPVIIIGVGVLLVARAFYRPRPDA